MKVVVTGGGGFVGGMLGRRLLARGELTGPSGRPEPIDRMVLLDVAHPPGADDDGDARVERVTGDVTDADLLGSVVDRDDVSVFHLASMVSGACEEDFDGALDANLGGIRAVLEAARARSSTPRVVFTSSIAAFGGEAVAGTVSDSTKLTPETTYGTTKAIGELLVNDYTRKGFVDGRSARLPTVVIRPGRPNAAASSWCSGIFREPLRGEEAVVPVDPDIRVPISGYRTLVDNLISLHEAPGADIGTDRGVNLPAIAVTAREMEDALRSVASDRTQGPITLGPITYGLDPTVSRIFAGWAQTSSSERASRLGLVADEGLAPIIEAYVEDFG